MDNIKSFMKSTSGKIITIIFFSIVITIGIILFINYQNTFRPYSYEEETPTGNTITVSNAENEQGDKLILNGFEIFYDFGFSSSQQQKISETIKTYCEENYPDFEIISYKKDSFTYPDPDDLSISTFTLISNTNKSFTINLNTNYSYTDIDIEITEE